MNDRAVALLEQYDVEILRTRKGRGVILCETENQVLCFQEYDGKERKLEIIEELTKKAEESGISVQRVLKTKEDSFLVKDTDGIVYILKTFPEGRELNVQEEKETKDAVAQMARLHKVMRLQNTEKIRGIPIFSVEQEYKKRNQEMIRVRKFLRRRGQKNPFEQRLSETIDSYLEKGLAVERSANESKASESVGEVVAAGTDLSGAAGVFCHGNFQYHHLIYQGNMLTITNFEKIMQDSQVRDLYYFLRKVMEKTDWNLHLGQKLVEEYEKYKPLRDEERRDLYYRFSYPEKYWKIANFYMNSHKTWVPGKNLEKLDFLVSQEQKKAEFIKAIGSF